MEKTYNPNCMKNAAKKIENSLDCNSIKFLRENKLIAICIYEESEANTYIRSCGIYDKFLDYEEDVCAYINKKGIFSDYDYLYGFYSDEDNLSTALEIAIAHSDKIRVVYDENYSPHWRFETDLPHETFRIMSDDEEMPEDDVFCEGIVLEAWRLKS